MWTVYLAIAALAWHSTLASPTKVENEGRTALEELEIYEQIIAFYSPKIVGGRPVIPHSIPYQLSFQHTRYGAFCGGTILTEYYGMTAAHCCINWSSFDSLSVVAGKHNLSRTEVGEQTVFVAHLFMHPKYDHSQILNDICLIRFQTPLTFTETVRAAHLPYKNEAFTSGKALVSGWGVGSSNNVLHSVLVPIVSDKACMVSYADFPIHSNMLCAGETDLDSCQGDSGGPLTCNLDAPVVCGIVSWGKGCGEKGYPGVYAEVSLYIDWIDSILSLH